MASKEGLFRRALGLFFALLLALALTASPAAAARASLLSGPDRPGLNASPAGAFEPAPLILPGKAPLSAGPGETLIIHTCSASGEDDYTNVAGTLSVVRSCSLTLPVAGKIFVIASGSVDYVDGGYVAIFSVNIDNPVRNESLIRPVQVINDPTNGDSDRAVSVSALFTVGAGTHTVYFTGERYMDEPVYGTGTVRMEDPSLSVVFIPSLYPAVKICAAQGDQNLYTGSTIFAIARQCSLTLSQPSDVFVIFNAGIYTPSSAVEAWLRLAVDGVSDETNERWVEVSKALGEYNTGQVSGVYASLPAGMHTFAGQVARYVITSGTVGLFDSSLVVIAVPQGDPVAQLKYNRGEEAIYVDSTTPVAFRNISGNMPAPGGRVLMVGDGGMDLDDKYYEALFEPVITGSAHNNEYTRRQTMFPGMIGSGMDAAFAVSRLEAVPAGTADYSLTASRVDGTGRILLYEPSLSVFFFPNTYYTVTRNLLPTIRR